jgi:hypothetical protein
MVRIIAIKIKLNVNHNGKCNQLKQSEFRSNQLTDGKFDEMKKSKSIN